MYPKEPKEYDVDNVDPKRRLNFDDVLSISGVRQAARDRLWHKINQGIQAASDDGHFSCTVCCRDIPDDIVTHLVSCGYRVQIRMHEECVVLLWS